MDFVRSNFDTNEPLPVGHFFPHFLAGLLRTQQSGQKVRKKVFNWQRFICTEVTSYKIHTLGTICNFWTIFLQWPYMETGK